MISLISIDDGLKKHFSTTLSAIIADLVHSTIHKGIAVAYSGGLDSSVLLSLTVDFAREREIPVFALHVHHGLSIDADNWLTHCQSVCKQADITFTAIKVAISNDNKLGIEAAARAERYGALGAFCLEHQLPLILTAHHQDDQAETVLLQLLRGSGVAGLSGMDLFNHAPVLLRNSSVLLARPLLTRRKQSLINYATKYNIDYVTDESNFDSRFVRNALRIKVMPMLAKISQGYSDRLARSAMHAQTAQRLLQELAQLDLENFLSKDGLDVLPLRQLSHERVENLLRFWLSTLSVRMPSTARLAEIRSQIFEARDDAKITICHDGLEIHRYKNKIVVSAQPSNLKPVVPIEFMWSGELFLHFPQFCGSLYFDISNYGVDANWLQQQKLILKIRSGGERLKVALNRPTRDLKSHFQSLNIPFWQRQHLPLLCVNEALLHASLVGTEASFCQHGEAKTLINFRWQAESKTH
ncbi:MAG: tRNA lysidine(34) synthetase TilS [Cytophaga sp.]|nr:tRNA lysidine(34) synthetase TilS [Undibacterium sp.]